MQRPEASDTESQTPILDRQSENTLSPETVLEDRYEVLRVIGHGGMSMVYLARDLRFHQVDRLCAIKEIFNRDASEEARLMRLENFEREAALLATLSHPAIPKIYDFFSTGGLIYLILEYIEGQDLERHIASQDMAVPEETLIEWALQILDVIAYLHEHKPEPLVFRDLKPSNIMLRTDGAISLIDFGIARTVQPLHRGTMVGTEGYAPPEQYRGIAEPRGDIYALGATLHHLATRSDPRSEAPFSFDQRPLRVLNPEISEAFEAVVERALSYDASARFPSAAAMAQALIDVRSKHASNTLEEEPAPAGKSTTPLISTLKAPERPDPDRQADADLPERILWSVQTGDEVRGTPAIANGHAYIGSYDQHLYAVSLDDGSIIWRFNADRGIVCRPLVDGNTIYVGAEDHTIYALRLATGQLTWSVRTAMPVRSSAATFGNAIVVGSDDGYCYCLDISQGTLIWRYRTWGPVRSSPLVVDNEITVGSDDGSVHHFSATDGRPVWRTPLGNKILSSPVIAEDTIVVGCADGTLYGLDRATGRRRWTRSTEGPIIASARLFADTAIVGSTDGTVYSVSTIDGSRRWESRIASQITASIAIEGAKGIVGTIDGSLFCLSLDNGETLWSISVGSPIVSTAAVADGIAVVGALNGRIYGARV